MNLWNELLKKSCIENYRLMHIRVLKDYIEKKINIIMNDYLYSHDGILNSIDFVCIFMGIPKNSSSIQLIEECVRNVISGGCIEKEKCKNIYQGIGPEEFDFISKLINDNRKIMAIKYCREKTGVGLREAKKYVEDMEEGTVSRPIVVEDWVPEEMWNI